jgi:hypothetical protein
MLKSLVDDSLVLALSSRFPTHPRVFTLSGKGRTYAALLGMQNTRRIRTSEELDKAHNLFFIQHTMAAIDVLIAARLLSQTVPGIALTRLFSERALKRKIYVAIPEPAMQGRGKTRHICIEPDASVDFSIEETWHQQTQVWQDFYHIEVYRNLPPLEWRFKQKVQGYVAMAQTGQHEECSIHQRSQSPSLPQLTNRKLCSSAGLRKRCMRCRKRDSAFSLPVLLPVRQARLSCFSNQSGSKPLAVPQHRFWSLRRDMRGELVLVGVHRLNLPETTYRDL